MFIHLWLEEEGVNSAIVFWIYNLLVMLTKLGRTGQNSFHLSQVSRGHNSSKLPSRSPAHTTQSHTGLTSLCIYSYRQFSSCCFDITVGLILIFYKHCFKSFAFLWYPDRKYTVHAQSTEQLRVTASFDLESYQGNLLNFWHKLWTENIFLSWFQSVRKPFLPVIADIP